MKTELKDLKHSFHNIALSNITFLPKNIDFLKKQTKKMLTSVKLRVPWYQKVYFLKLHMCHSLSSPRPVKASSNPIRYYCQKICG